MTEMNPDIQEKLNQKFPGYTSYDGCYKQETQLESAKKLVGICNSSSNTPPNTPNYLGFACPDRIECGNLTAFRDGIGIVSGLRSTMYGESVMVTNNDRKGKGCIALAYNLRLDGLRNLINSQRKRGIGLSVPKPNIPSSWVSNPEGTGLKMFDWDASTGHTPDKNLVFFWNSVLSLCERWLIAYLDKLAVRCI